MFSPRTATCLLILLAVPPTVSTPTAVPNTTTSHCRVMQFGDFAEIDGALVVIHGVLGPTSFFKNLRCVASGDNTAFMNDMSEAGTFPNRLTITLFIIGPVPKNEFAQPKSLDAEYMLGLSFNANWKRGLKLRPVKAFRQLSASESRAPDLAVHLTARQCWIYEFVVEDADVPLTDHLILSIVSPENKRLARLSAYL